MLSLPGVVRRSEASLFLRCTITVVQMRGVSHAFAGTAGLQISLLFFPL